MPKNKNSRALNDELHSLIELALRTTLITVRTSSNLTTVKFIKVMPDEKDNSILIPLANYFSEHWNTFIINRTYSHSQFANKYLISTYRRNSISNNWEPVFKIASQQFNVYFEKASRRNSYSNLEQKQKNFVVANIQSRNERTGNCQILAYTLFYYLWSNLIKLNLEHIKSIEIINFNSLDHSFLLINRSPNSTLNNHQAWDGIIIDSWQGIGQNPSIFHSKKFQSYYDKLRTERPDIISGVYYSLGVSLILSVTEPYIPENVELFNKLDDFINYGKMELVSGKQSCKAKYIAGHKLRFFAVTEQLVQRKSTHSPRWIEN